MAYITLAGPQALRHCSARLPASGNGVLGSGVPGAIGGYFFRLGSNSLTIFSMLFTDIDDAPIHHNDWSAARDGRVELTYLSPRRPSASWASATNRDANVGGSGGASWWHAEDGALDKPDPGILA